MALDVQITSHAAIDFGAQSLGSMWAKSKWMWKYRESYNYSKKRDGIGRTEGYIENHIYIYMIEKPH
jgi:hypothetical protein